MITACLQPGTNNPRTAFSTALLPAPAGKKNKPREGRCTSHNERTVVICFAIATLIRRTQPHATHAGCIQSVQLLDHGIQAVIKLTCTIVCAFFEELGAFDNVCKTQRQLATWHNAN
eukprot:TRINITY_DN15546_c0_g1_i2.p2 TRINITY_DN15546_c0_g1~~TRINITY_DN15546_c0_g1_i2.p2  ORF type:complete len:117 (-),score=3.97 TRINITY_DN15546_c0_g1_i2:50-400(-)